MNNLKNNKTLSINKTIITIVAVIVVIVVIFFGYRIFGKKASNSTALVELKQLQELVLSDLVSATGDADLEINCDGVIFAYSVETGKVVFSGTLKTNDNGKTFTEEIKKRITDANGIKGTFNYEDGVIIYTTSNGMGKATWESGKTPKKANWTISELFK